MPNFYTHYLFGQRALAAMTAEQAKAAAADLNVFNLGLQGPDVFFYGSVFGSKSATKFGQKLHKLSGRNVFETMLSPYDTAAVPASVRACIMGVVGHFTLDVVVHPYVYEVQTDMPHHLALESDFDAYLMRCAGQSSPWTNNLYELIAADRQTQEVIAEVYAPWPEISRKSCMSSVRNMRTIRRMMRTPTVSRFRFVRRVMKIMGIYKALYGMLLPPPVPEFPDGVLWPDKPQDAMEKMDELLTEALPIYLENLTALDERIENRTPLPAFFDRDFSGTQMEDVQVENEK